MIPRFLPFSTKSALPSWPSLVRLYLRVPLAHRLLGKQMFVVAAPTQPADRRRLRRLCARIGGRPLRRRLLHGKNAAPVNRRRRSGALQAQGGRVTHCRTKLVAPPPDAA
jgi:hypothetical protein